MPGTQITKGEKMTTPLIVARRLADVEMNDTIRWFNDTGDDVVNNQLVFIDGNTGFGLVGVAVGQQPIAPGELPNVIPDGEWGHVIIKMRVQLPASACAITQGQTVQAFATSGAVTVGGTSAGLYAVGMAAAPNTSTASAGWVDVDLNFGPQAFKVW